MFFYPNNRKARPRQVVHTFSHPQTIVKKRNDKSNNVECREYTILTLKLIYIAVGVDELRAYHLYFEIAAILRTAQCNRPYERDNLYTHSVPLEYLYYDICDFNRLVMWYKHICTCPTCTLGQPNVLY